MEGEKYQRGLDAPPFLPDAGIYLLVCLRGEHKGMSDLTNLAHVRQPWKGYGETLKQNQDRQEETDAV